MRLRRPQPLLAARAWILVLGLFLGSCDSREQSGNSADLSKVTLRLGDQVRLLRAKAEAAKVFEGVPYRVEWVNFQGAAPLFEALAADVIDTGIAAQSPVVFAAAAGTPMKVIAASREPTGQNVGIIVPPDSPVNSVADLKGREVIASAARGSVSHYHLIEALREAGLTTADIKLGFMLPVDAQVAFKSGHIGIWATFGVYLAIAEAQGARVIRDGKGLSPPLGFLTASNKALADPSKHAAIEDVVRRLARADTWALTHQEDYAKVFSAVTGVPLDVSATLASRQLAVWKPIDEPAVTSLQHVADLFMEEHVLSHEVDVRSSFDPSVFPSAP